MAVLRITNVIIVAVLVAHTAAQIPSPPLITKQPPTDEVLFQVAQKHEVDKPFFIECEANGEPTPNYRWMKNGKPFDWHAYDDRITQQPGRGTLIITSPRVEDLGQYQCFAENEWGIATSNSVFVRKAELNSFKDADLLTLDVTEGEPYKLSCAVPDAWPKPKVYWLRQSTDGGIASINNTRMTVDPEGNLWVSSATRQDASRGFVYVCGVTSVPLNQYKLGNRVVINVISSGLADGNQHAPTQQYVTRRNEVGLRGKNVELYCIFGGNPLPTTTWYKDGVRLALSDHISQSNYGKTLIIKNAQFEDEGSYTCEVSNGIGMPKSYSTNLQVMAVPYFTVEPEITIGSKGETVELGCEATGVPEPTVNWIHNGKPINEAPPNPRRQVTANKIVIQSLENTDTGNYGCNATNSLGYVYKDVYVNVISLPPEITEPPMNITTVDGRTVTLTCRVFGAPKPLVKWIRNRLELTGGRYSVLDSGDLEIKDVNLMDAGKYTCIAENKLGSAEHSAELSVKDHTRITDQPEDYEVLAGLDAMFRCNAINDLSLPLTIEWLQNGNVIDFDSAHRFVMSSDNSLKISQTTELDSGTYTCRAKTDLDEASAHATLTVQDVPNPPELTNIVCREHIADISWEPRGNNRSPITHYIIQYSTSFTPDTWSVVNDNIPAAATTFAVPLSPWSNYTFQVIAVNKNGPSVPSPHSEVCTTQPDVPYKNPDNVEGKGTEPNNLVILWTPMPEIDHNGPRFIYRVFWKRDSPGLDWNIEDINDWNRSYLLIPDQPTFQKYRIKVLALNEKGEANVAPKEIDGYSVEDVPTQSPTNFTLLQIISSNSVLLSWNPVLPETLRGHFKGYKIQTWTDKDGEMGMKETHFKNDTTKALVRNFIPNTKNYARVLAYNGQYNGPASEVVDFDTPEGVPGPVAGLEAYPLGSSALYLVWKPPEQPNGILTGYKIYYETVRNYKVGPRVEREPHISEPTRTRAKLAGLDAGVKYRITITATTRAGEGEPYYIEQRTRSNMAVKPDIPQFKWVREPSDNGDATVKVIWIPNVEGTPGSEFFVQYKRKEESVFNVTPREQHEDFIIIRGLMPGQVYDFRVVAVDGDYTTESAPQDVYTYSVEK